MLYQYLKNISSGMRHPITWRGKKESFNPLRFYRKHESKDRIPKIAEYYATFTLIIPNYGAFSTKKYLQKNKYKKKKILDKIEELQNRRNNPNCANDDIREEEDSISANNDDIEMESCNSVKDISKKKKNKKTKTCSHLLNPSMIVSNILKGDISFSEISVDNSFFEDSLLNLNPNKDENNISKISSKTDIVASMLFQGNINDFICEKGVENKNGVMNNKNYLLRGMTPMPATTGNGNGITIKHNTHFTGVNVNHQTNSSSRNFHIQFSDADKNRKKNHVNNINNVDFGVEIGWATGKEEKEKQHKEVKISNLAINALNNDDIIKKQVPLNIKQKMTNLITRPNTSIALKIDNTKERLKKVQINLPSKDKAVESSTKKSIDNFSKVKSEKSTFDSTISKVLNSKMNVTGSIVSSNKNQSGISSKSKNMLFKKKKIVKSNEDVKPVMMKEKLLEVRPKPCITPISVYSIYSSNNSNVNSIPNDRKTPSSNKNNQLQGHGHGHNPQNSIKSPTPTNKQISNNKKTPTDNHKALVGVKKEETKSKENKDNHDFSKANKVISVSNGTGIGIHGLSRMSPSIPGGDINSKILSATSSISKSKTIAKFVTATPTPTHEKKVVEAFSKEKKSIESNSTSKEKTGTIGTGSHQNSKPNPINTVLGKEKAINMKNINKNKEQHKKNIPSNNNLDAGLSEISGLIKSSIQNKIMHVQANSLDKKDNSFKSNLEKDRERYNQSQVPTTKQTTKVNSNTSTEKDAKINYSSCKPSFIQSNNFISNSSSKKGSPSPYKNQNFNVGKTHTSHPSQPINPINPNNNLLSGLSSETPTPFNDGGFTDRISVDPPISPPITNTILETVGILGVSEEKKKKIIEDKIKEMNSMVHERATPQPTASNHHNNLYNSNFTKKPNTPVSSGVIPNNNLLNSRNMKNAILKNDTLKSQISPDKSKIPTSSNPSVNFSKPKEETVYSKKSDLKASQSKVLSVDNKIPNSTISNLTNELMNCKNKILSSAKTNTKSPFLVQKNSHMSGSKAISYNSNSTNHAKNNDKGSNIRTKLESELNFIEHNRQNINPGQVEVKKTSLMNTLKLTATQGQASHGSQGSTVLKKQMNNNNYKNSIMKGYDSHLPKQSEKISKGSHVNSGRKSPCVKY